MRAPTWDTHAHVIGDPVRFPFAAGRSYTPAAASLEDYLAMLDSHGLTHGVLVQPSVYGTDNTCMLDALERAGGRLLGIAVPPPDAGTRELEALHARGVRGVRCNLVNPGGLSPGIIRGWAPAMRALRWHVEVHSKLDDVSDVHALVTQFRLPVVIDHMGRPADVNPSSPPLRALLDLVRAGECFVKLSAPYRFSTQAPSWPDVVPLARAFLSANPQACLWGTDWPHVDTPIAVQTDDVFAALDSWCDDAIVRRALITDTPPSLFVSGVTS